MKTEFRLPGRSSSLFFFERSRNSDFCCVSGFLAMNSIFIHFNVTAALFFFRDSNKGLFVDNCFMMIGKQIPCSLLALRRVAHENCGCSRTTAIFFIAEKRIDRSSTPFRLSCWRRYGTRFEFVDNTDNTIRSSKGLRLVSIGTESVLLTSPLGVCCSTGLIGEHSFSISS